MHPTAAAAKGPLQMPWKLQAGSVCCQLPCPPDRSSAVSPVHSDTQPRPSGVSCTCPARFSDLRSVRLDSAPMPALEMNSSRRSPSELKSRCVRPAARTGSRQMRRPGCSPH